MEPSGPPNGQGTTPQMTVQRLQQLLDAYGANPDHWPPEEREAALELLEHSADARAKRDSAGRLDTVLDLAPAHQPSQELADRILARAPEPRAEVVTGPALAHLRASARSTPGNGNRVHRTRRYLAAAAPLAAAATIVLWLTRGPEQPTRGPMQLTIAELGIYETPTDVLLEPLTFDLLRAVPALGCPDSELGCPELSFPDELESSLDPARRTYV